MRVGVASPDDHYCVWAGNADGLTTVATLLQVWKRTLKMAASAPLRELRLFALAVDFRKSLLRRSREGEGVDAGLLSDIDASS